MHGGREQCGREQRRGGWKDIRVDYEGRIAPWRGHVEGPIGVAGQVGWGTEMYILGTPFYLIRFPPEKEWS